MKRRTMRWPGGVGGVIPRGTRAAIAGVTCGIVAWPTLEEVHLRAMALHPRHGVIGLDDDGLGAWALDGTLAWRHAIEGQPRTLGVADDGTIYTFNEDYNGVDDGIVTTLVV